MSKWTEFKIVVPITIQLGHRCPDFWTQWSTLSRSTTVHNVLILGQLGKEMENSIKTANIYK
jgi:hypothetical protein